MIDPFSSKILLLVLDDLMDACSNFIVNWAIPFLVGNTDHVIGVVCENYAHAGGFFKRWDGLWHCPCPLTANLEYSQGSVEAFSRDQVCQEEFKGSKKINFSVEGYFS